MTGNEVVPKEVGYLIHTSQIYPTLELRLQSRGHAWVSLSEFYEWMLFIYFHELGEWELREEIGSAMLCDESEVGTDDMLAEYEKTMGRAADVANAVMAACPILFPLLDIYIPKDILNTYTWAGCSANRHWLRVDFVEVVEF